MKGCLPVVVLLAALLPAAEPSPKDKLFDACRQGRREVVQELLSSGVSANSKNAQGASPLHFAVMAGHKDIVQVLISAGADVNAKDSTGRTALTEAVGSLKPGLVEALLLAGARADDQALSQASWLGKPRYVYLLLNAGADPDAGMVSAAQAGRVDLLKALHESGGSVNTRTKSGSRPLHTAALQGGSATVDYLLQAGADPNVFNDRHETPLHCAVAGNHELETVKLLVTAGARLDAANDEGATPIRLAAIRKAPDLYEFMLAASGGKEPPADLPRDRRQPEATLESLFGQITSMQHTTRLAAQRELIARGRAMVPEIVERLKSSDQGGQLLEVLSTMGPPAEDAMPQLISMLDNKRTVLAAAWTIDRMKPGAFSGLPIENRRIAAQRLYESVVDPDSPESRETAPYAVSNLAIMGDVAIPHFRKLLQDPKHRQLGIYGLRSATFSDSEITSQLIRSLSPENALVVRSEAAAALGQFGEATPEVKAALLAMVMNPPPYRVPHVSEAETKAYQSWDQVARIAASSLSRFGPAVIDELVPILTPINSVRRIAAINTLVSLGSAGVPRLIELLAHEDNAVAVSASVALNRIGRPAVAALARELRSNHNKQVAQLICNAFWWMGRGAKPGLPALWDVVRDEGRTDSVRVTAEWAALKVDAAESRRSEAVVELIPTLIRAVEEGPPEDQRPAVEALEALGSVAKEALPVLKKRLERPGNASNDKRWQADGHLRQAIQRAIQAIDSSGQER